MKDFDLSNKNKSPTKSMFFDKKEITPIKS